MQDHIKTQFANDIKSTKYIDDYIGKWLKLETLDKPYVECEICGYVSNASIHQHLLVPQEFGINTDNRIIHLCSNCNYELRAMMDRRRREITPQTIRRICEQVFEDLKDKKKRYREMNQSLERIEV